MVHQYSCSTISGWTQKMGNFPKSHINSLKTSLVYLSILSVCSSLGLVEERFMELTKRHFANFHNLNRAAKVRHYL